MIDRRPPPPEKPNNPDADKIVAAKILAACEGKPVRRVTTEWIDETRAKVQPVRRFRVTP